MIAGVNRQIYPQVFLSYWREEVHEQSMAEMVWRRICVSRNWMAKRGAEQKRRGSGFQKAILIMMHCGGINDP